jgi:peptidoglycan hydrolase-like protein with peptidoglycan-binding domain
MKLLPYAAGLAAAAVLAPVAASAAWSSPAANSSALPSVNMEATVKAAQIDPRRADDTLTRGAKSSVLLVEQALQAKNLLDARWVDGYFGTTTVAAYTQYQKSLGYTGLDANGLPGQTSLTKLGTGRFTIANVIGPGTRIDTGGGIIINTRTKNMLAAAETILGRTLALDQGSYNPGGDPTSAGTHDGGGVVDVSVAGMTAAYRVTVARALRTVGFAAWVRDPSQGDWPYHIHAAAISDTDLSPQAQHQTGDYYLGKNGLANGAADDGPKVTPIRTWEEYQRQ